MAYNTGVIANTATNTRNFSNPPKELDDIHLIACSERGKMMVILGKEWNAELMDWWVLPYFR